MEEQIKPKYDQNYCKKHNQYYGDHLHRCPICVGEEIQIELDKTVQHLDLTGVKIMEDKGV